MEPSYLKQLVEIQPQGAKTDLNAPFSYLEWKARRPVVIDKDAQFHYNQYVLEWFSRNKEKQLSQKFVLRQKYLYLLDQLQLYFSEEEKNIWYNKVNLADEKELLLAIPYFAKKLKDVALYYLKLRNNLKNTKLKYNTVGTATAIKREIYRCLLETYSSLNLELSPTLQTIVPQFSALQDSLTVDIEEVYDDHQYFDQSPTAPLSGYYNLFHDATEKFFETKGLVLSSAEWLFDSFNLTPTADLDSLVNQLTGNIFETSDSNLYGSFIQKYLSENKFTTTFTVASSVIETNDVSINQGNNYFYYPSGTVDTSISIQGRIKPVALSSIQMEGATSGSTLEDSDVIFVKNGEEIEGAWFYYKEYEESNKTVKASLRQNATTSFIFPFPGYGLSAANIPWTGSSFETNPGYDFLSKELKANVNNAYWSQTLLPDTHNTIQLNNTTLVNSGAYPSKNPNFADQIHVRTDRPSDTTIPYGELSGAWLYEFTRTSLPVSPNSTNTIFWPYTIVDENSEFSSYLNQLSLQNAARPVALRNLDTSLSIAASSFELADKIYKLNNFTDENSVALECAWLSSGTIDLSGYRTPKQDGFSVLFPSGQFTRFLWSGPEVSLNEVFVATKHQKDCPFVTNVPSVSTFEWQKCTCKHVYYSPFGHSGRQLQDNNLLADCIFEDTTSNLEEVDFGSWRDSLSGNFENSLQIAWYKTSTNFEWGNGNWISNNLLSALPFTLKPGKTYFYRRATSKTQPEEFPPYSVNKKFSTTNAVWAEAKLQLDGTWSSTGRQSEMKLNSGDFIRYERQPATTSYLISSIQVENESENINTAWSAFDKVTLSPAANTTSIFWPTENKPFGSNDPQYPSTQFADITAINAWQITRIQDGVTQTLLNQFVVTFAPPTTGTYTIAVTATKAGGQKIFESTNIPRITAVSQFSNEEILLDFTTPTNGFLIEQDLFGWNYTTNKPQANAPGAKPYWAELYFDKSSTTKFKGVYSWGYPNRYIDEYLPNSNPILSPLEVSYGSVIDYNRKYYTFEWAQPITYKTFIGQSQWSQLSSSTTNFSNLSSLYRSKRQEELTVNYNTNPTNITLTNTKNGLPVEILYYALNSFVWTVSVETTPEIEPPTPELFFSVPKPWANLSNRFFPTIATVPVLEDVYTKDDVGGYFTPQNLGASQFINKDFNASFETLNLSGQFLTEDQQVHIGGRGLSKQDQNSLYTWEEKNQWLKESPVAGQLAGAVRKDLTKTLQTFVPYQTNSDQTFLGLVTPNSRVSPWGGPTSDQWTDLKNEPKSFTGVRNVSAWAESQILKQNEKVIDSWTTDVFGNQYGLFKQLSGVRVSERPNVPGQLWTRTNNQMVNPAYKSLSAVFNLFESDSTFYSQLTGEGIKSVDCFFDTLLIETSSYLLLIQLDYDYEKATISTVFDNIVIEPLNNNKRFEQVWFMPESKKLIVLFTRTSSNNFYPELMELDLSSKIYTKKFPTTITTSSELSSNLSDVQFNTLSRAAIHYNRTKQSYLLTYQGTTINNKLFVVDFEIEQRETAVLNKINKYLDTTSVSAIIEPPVVFNQFLNVINTGMSFSVQVSATNNPISYTIVNPISGISVTNNGLFVGSLSSQGLYHINYDVSNSIGTNTFCLTINAQ